MPNPRKPTQLKVIQGTFRRHRALPNEPKPARVTRLRPPAHLSARAKAAWRAVARIAGAMGVLTVADQLALEAVAGALADLRAAREALAKPLIRTDADGIERELAAGGGRYYWNGAMRRQRPELGDITDAEHRLWVGLGRFGLSPSDRARVATAWGEAKAGNPFAQIG
jgi:P27 family predicted phage terminase small subunit